jgi:hypothetical protein
MTQPGIIYSIFVSSTSEDLAPYRARARDILLTHNLRPLEMEYFPAQSGPTTNALDHYLDSADGVVLIAGARYGSRVGQLSYVEWEFERALVRGIPVVCLVMSKGERNRVRAVSKEDKDRQEHFIQRLMQHSKIAEFDKTNFDLALAGALSLFPRQFSAGAGLIRVAEHNELLAAASSELRNLRTHQSLLRLLSAAGLIQQHTRYLGGGGSRRMNSDQERAELGRFLDLLYQDLANRPVINRTVETIVRRLIERLHNLSGPVGFVPESLGELEASINELFGDTLSTLRATSIHSNHDALVNYKGYWQDSELGPFFRHKNEQFLARPGTRRLLRVFACDSVASAVGQEWFAETAIQQVSQGASVKVIQIDPAKVSTYEDFGIYEHRSGKNSDGNYLLLAPRDRNLQQPSLTTSVIADSGVVADYMRKFEVLWAQSAEPLEILEPTRLEEAGRKPLESHGLGRVSDLLNQQIILRSMERLDTGEKLLGTSRGFARKYQQPYAKAISDHLKRRFPGVKRVLYIGDTYKNDGTVIRNLQALGWDASGLICEPSLGIERLWFDDILYTNHWADLVGFIDKVQSKVGPTTLAIFDIDQTLWAPKGVHEGPLSNTRTAAMSRLIDEYVVDPDNEVARSAKARIDPLYHEISEAKYLGLTVDNEDFKAAICVFLSLNIVFNQQRLESNGREAGAAVFEELGRLGAIEFTEFIRTSYISNFAHPSRVDEANITRFIMETLSTVQTYQYGLYGEANGILVAKIIDHIQHIFRETVGVAPTQYSAFRAKELEEALGSVGEDRDFDERLVLNKPAWDVGMWLKRRGAVLLGLSDRPDESTVSADGRSLLDASMMIYGQDISGLLPGG